MPNNVKPEPKVSPVATQTKPPRKRHFEYKQLPWPGVDKLTTALNKAAEDGWEYVPVMPTGGSLIVLLRREVQ